VGLREAIRAGYLPLLAIPQEQVTVVRIEAIEIESASGAFANRTIRDLAEAADLAQRLGNVRRIGDEHLKIVELGEKRLRPETRDLTGDGRRCSSAAAERGASSPERDRDGRAALLQKLARQQRGAQRRMNPAERVKHPAVVPVDAGADHLRAAAIS